MCGDLRSSSIIQNTFFFILFFFYENGASASSCCASFHFFFLILLSFMKYDQVFAFQRQTSCRQQLPRSWQPPRPIEHLYHYYNAAAGSSDIQISSSGPVRQPHYTQYCTHTQGHTSSPSRKGKMSQMLPTLNWAENVRLHFQPVPLLNMSL